MVRVWLSYDRILYIFVIFVFPLLATFSLSQLVMIVCNVGGVSSTSTTTGGVLQSAAKWNVGFHCPFTLVPTPHCKFLTMVPSLHCYCQCQ